MVANMTPPDEQPVDERQPIEEGRLTEERRMVAELGAAVRAGRRRLELSVQGLADRAGVSLGFVSQLERGMGNPSLQSIQRIAQALGVPAAQLLDGPNEDIAIVRADRRHLLPAITGEPLARQPVRELLSPRGQTLLQLIRTTLPPGFTNEGRPYRHLATESVTVERGRLRLVHGTTDVVLEQGDTATYSCSTSHWWANAADEPTIVVGAVTPVER